MEKRGDGRGGGEAAGAAFPLFMGVLVEAWGPHVPDRWVRIGSGPIPAATAGCAWPCHARADEKERERKKEGAANALCAARLVKGKEERRVRSKDACGDWTARIDPFVAPGRPRRCQHKCYTRTTARALPFFHQRIRDRVFLLAKKKEKNTNYYFLLLFCG